MSMEAGVLLRSDGPTTLVSQTPCRGAHRPRPVSCKRTTRMFPDFFGNQEAAAALFALTQ